MSLSKIWVAAALATFVAASVQERYVPSTDQLVVELFVDDLDRSIEFYRELGFELVRREGEFAELTWEDHFFFLDASRAPPNVDSPAANVRVMVRDVDARWNRARAAGARVLVPIDDRYYGLRDFTILDPDGFGIRFASRLSR